MIHFNLLRWSFHIPLHLRPRLYPSQRSMLRLTTLSRMEQPPITPQKQAKLLSSCNYSPSVSFVSGISAWRTREQVSNYSRYEHSCDHAYTFFSLGEIVTRCAAPQRPRGGQYDLVQLQRLIPPSTRVDPSRHSHNVLLLSAFSSHRTAATPHPT